MNWAVNSKFDGVAWSSLTTFDQVDAEGSLQRRQNPDSPSTAAPALLRNWTPVTGTLAARHLPADRRDQDACPRRLRGNHRCRRRQGAEKTYTVASPRIGHDDRWRHWPPCGCAATEFGTLRELPSDFPDELRLFAASAMSTGTTPYTRLEALADTLSSSPYQSRSIRSRIRWTPQPCWTWFGARSAGLRRVFATAFALMAAARVPRPGWSWGIPTAGKGRSRTVESTDVIVYPGGHEGGLGSVPPGPRDGARVPVIRKVKPPKDPPAEETPTPTRRQHTPTDAESVAGATGADAVTGLDTAAHGCAGHPAADRLAGAGRLVAGTMRRRLETGSPDERAIGAWTYVRARRRRLGTAGGHGRRRGSQRIGNRAQTGRTRASGRSRDVRP